MFCKDIKYLGFCYTCEGVIVCISFHLWREESEINLYLNTYNKLHKLISGNILHIEIIFTDRFKFRIARPSSQADVRRHRQDIRHTPGICAC